MIAGVLAKLGFDMGHGGHPGFTDWLHPKGIWESEDFKRLNKLILKACGMERNYRYVDTFPGPEAISNTALHLYDMMQEYCDQRPAMWGVKDPRVALTAHAWHPLLPDPHYIYWTRTGVSTTQPTKEETVRAWRKRIERFIVDKKAAHFNYEYILDHPKKELYRLADFLDVAVTKEALEMIDTKLNNSRVKE